MVAAQKLRPLPVVQKEWTQDYEPFRICGNLYYVGTYDLACFLITTPKGHILINTGLAESVPMIRSHIEALGFRFADIKILLTTQAHYDHVAGMAEIKKRTGARMIINEKDASVLADGGNSDYIFGGKGSLFLPVKADQVLHEKDTLYWGGMQIVALHHPGHTKGATSFLFTVKDEQRAYRVLIANMPSVLEETRLTGMPTYPEVGSDYAHTFSEMKKLQFDIWLSSHASQFGLHQKRKVGDPYRPEAFMDQKGYNDAITDLEKQYQQKLSAR
jgi:metallo-beta-lactamase class B